MTPDWVESSSRSHSNVNLFAAVSAALTEIPGHLKSRFYALSVSEIGAICMPLNLYAIHHWDLSIFYPRFKCNLS